MNIYEAIYITIIVVCVVDGFYTVRRALKRLKR